MSNTQYTQISMPTDIQNQDVYNATEVLVDDINQLYQDEYNVSQTNKALQQNMDKLSGQSSDEFGSCWITLVTETMNLDCNIMAGLMVCMADTMNILSDIRNITTLSQNGYMSMTSRASEPGYAGSQDQIDDMECFEESLDVLTTTQLTVTDANGQVTTANGIISLLSDPQYWPGQAPMSTQTADLLNTDIDGIENYFTDWGNSSSMWDQIYAWAVPTPDEDGIVTSDPTVSAITNDYTSIGNAIDSDTNKLTSELQVAMTEYQSYQDTWEQIMQYMADWNKTALQGMGA